MLAEGLGNKAIASRLAISSHTAKFHVAAIMGKLGAGSRTEAVASPCGAGWWRSDGELPGRECRGRGSFMPSCEATKPRLS